VVKRPVGVVVRVTRTLEIHWLLVTQRTNDELRIKTLGRVFFPEGFPN